jgi:putative glutamine amidotransferase
MRPVIGVLAEVDDEAATRVMRSYIHALEASGGAPLLLPYTEDPEVLSRFAEVCDGFCFTGGKDVDPKHYGEERHPGCEAIAPLRDALELVVFAAVYPTGKPILGICRGAQLINVAMGGTLYQDLPTQRPSAIAHRQSQPKTEPSHSVRILAGSPLFEQIGAERMQANSFHHQAIKTPGKGLEIWAVADDGVIEAVGLPGERYLHAYQWHPERLCDGDADNRKIFERFVEACRSEG